CKGPKNLCPRPDRVIQNGELRFGTEGDQPKGVTWIHWTCCTDKLFESMHKTLSNPKEIRGWNDLRDEDKERIQKEWDTGRIFDNENPTLAPNKDAM
ncbi:hypothetical protein BY458DRAFT_439903, partial [Sporodiniella umbellata]